MCFRGSMVSEARKVRFTSRMASATMSPYGGGGRQPGLNAPIQDTDPAQRLIVVVPNTSKSYHPPWKLLLRRGQSRGIVL